MRGRLLPLLAGLFLLPALAARADCDTRRMLDKVTDHGAMVELDNGTQWKVADLDRPTAERWKQDAPITACTDELINREDHETVRAQKTSDSRY